MTTEPSVTGPDASPGTLHDAHQFQRLWSILRRGFPVIAAFVGVALILATTYTVVVQPVYESTARVLINMDAKQGPLSFFDFKGLAATNKISNELETLRSQVLTRAVAEALITRKYLEGSPRAPIPMIALLETGKHDTTAMALRVAQALMKSVGITAARESDIIKITARSPDPREAALVANTFAEVYTKRNLDASREKSRTIREFLDIQLANETVLLDSAEATLQTFMKSSQIVTLDAEAKRVVEKLAELEASRNAIEIDIRSRSKTLSSYKEQIAKQEPTVAKSIGESNDAYIRLLQEQLATLEVQRDLVIAQNTTLAGKKIYDQKLKEIEPQIASLRDKLRDRTQAFLTSLGPGEGGAGTREGSAAFLGQVKQKVIELQIELDGLVAKKAALDRVIQSYEQRFGEIPGKSIHLAQLQRSALSREKLYLLLKEKYNEVALKERSEFGYVDILDPAIVPPKPVAPDLFLNLALACLIGFSLGIATVFVRATVDARFREPDDVRRHGFFTLSTIGHITSETSEDRLEVSPSLPCRNFDTRLVAFFNPLSPIAESYRFLQANLQRTQRVRPPHSIMVTSPSPRDGKTTTIANLAITMADAERKVILIDADLRRPSVHTLFDCTLEPGLTDLLAGTSTIEQAIQRQILPNLDFIASGVTPRNPAGILGSVKLQRLLDQLTRTYDVVLFDSPPLFAVSDAIILATRVDGTILVATSEVTRVASIQRAAQSLTGIGGRLLGVVLNNFDVRKLYGLPDSIGEYGYYAEGYARHSKGDGSGPRRAWTGSLHNVKTRTSSIQHK